MRSLSAAWGAAAFGAAVVDAVQAGAGGESAGPAGNRRGWMWRCSQLNHN